MVTLVDGWWEAAYYALLAVGPSGHLVMWLRGHPAASSAASLIDACRLRNLDHDGQLSGRTGGQSACSDHQHSAE
jgi:hypothetical protein